MVLGAAIHTVHVSVLRDGNESSEQLKYSDFSALGQFYEVFEAAFTNTVHDVISGLLICSLCHTFDVFYCCSCSSYQPTQGESDPKQGEVVSLDSTLM